MPMDVKEIKIARVNFMFPVIWALQKAMMLIKLRQKQGEHFYGKGRFASI